MDDKDFDAIVANADVEVTWAHIYESLNEEQLRAAVVVVGQAHLLEDVFATMSDEQREVVKYLVNIVIDGKDN